MPIITNVDVMHEIRANLSDEDIQQIVKSWYEIARSKQMKCSEKEEKLFVYILTEMDQQGVLLQTIRTISQNIVMNENEVRNILNKLVRLKIIYKRYGVLGIL